MRNRRYFKNLKKLEANFHALEKGYERLPKHVPYANVKKAVKEKNYKFIEHQTANRSKVRLILHNEEIFLVINRHDDQIITVLPSPENEKENLEIERKLEEEYITGIVARTLETLIPPEKSFWQKTKDFFWPYPAS